MAVAADPDRPTDQRTRLDHRAFADEHIALDHRLVMRLAKLRRSQGVAKIVADVREHLPRLAKRVEQARVLRLAKVEQLIGSGNVWCGLHARLAKWKQKSPSGGKAFCSLNL